MLAPGVVSPLTVAVVGHLLCLADDPVMDMITDYSQVCIQLGFVTLFVVANPIIPLIGLVRQHEACTSILIHANLPHRMVVRAIGVL